MDLNMSVGLGSQIGMAGGVGIINFCIDPVGNDGIVSKFGFIKDQFGTALPVETADKTPLYEWTWQGDGSFIISFGATGDTKLTGVEKILITTPSGYADVAEWNETATAYIFTDVPTATQLIDDNTQKLCLKMSILPVKFMQITYANMVREEYEAYFENTIVLMGNKYKGKAYGGNWVIPTDEGMDYPILDNGNSGYLTYLDYATQKHIQIANRNDPDNSNTNLVKNSEFDSEDEWVIGSFWIISGGILSIPSEGTKYNVTQKDVLKPNRSFVITPIPTIDNEGVSVGYHDGSSYVLTDNTGAIPFNVLIDVGATTLSDDFSLYIRSMYNTITSLESITIREVLAVSTVYNLVDTHQAVFNHTAPLSQADLDALDANPNLIHEVWSNAYVLPSGFSKTDMGNFFGNNEGNFGYVQDLSVPAEELLAPAYTFGTTRGTVTDNGDGTFTFTCTDDSSTSYAYIRCSLTGSSGAFTRNLIDGEVLSSSFRFKGSTLDCIIRSTALNIPSIYVDEVDTWKNYTSVRAVDDPVSDTGYLEFEINNPIIGDTLTIDTNVLHFRAVETVKISGTYTTANRLFNQSKGANSLLLRQDGSGRALSVMPNGSIAVDASNGKKVDTSLNIVGKGYTIIQKISGLLEVLDSGGNATGLQTQRTEERVLTHEEGVADLLYIDVDDSGTFVLQPYTPVLPTGILRATNIASIGYPDYVDTHYGDLTVGHEIIVP